MITVRTQVIDIATDFFGRIAYRSALSKNKKISHTIKVKGHRIWYHDIGQGHPIVFLHGLGSNSLSWLMTLPAFCQDYRVIAIDHIGHGRSDKPEIPYKITDFVDYLEAFLSALGLKHVDLVGSSLGGWIAARLALRRPDLVNRLVLVGSAGLQPWPELREKLENTKFAPRTTQEVKTFLSMCFYDKVRYTNQFSVLVSYLIRSLDDSYGTIEKVLESALDPNEWLDGKLAEIRAKTLVLWGQEDELMPVEFANQFANHIPNAELEILNQCGHVPQIERAKDFNLILKNFFK
jgi:pimeloyl-ACP methyl ester carboxylesterase